MTLYLLKYPYFQRIFASGTTTGSDSALEKRWAPLLLAGASLLPGHLLILDAVSGSTLRPASADLVVVRTGDAAP